MTEDFKITLIELLTQAIPELKGKVQHVAVDEGTQTPYAVFSTPEEVPIRTKHGIVGCVSTFELVVVGRLMVELEQLKTKIINALDGKIIGRQKISYLGSESQYYDQTNTHGYSITLKIK